MSDYLPPSPAESWLLGGVTAVLQEGIGQQLGYWVGPGGVLSHDDGSGNGWQLAWLPGGRAVISGFDVDYSTEREVAQLLAGAPPWVPAPAERAGFCFWWESDGGGWRCAAGASDPGMRLTGSVEHVEERLADRVWERIPEPDDEDGDESEEELDEWAYVEGFHRRLEELLAAAREQRLTDGELVPVLAFLADPQEQRTAGALALAAQAGFTAGSRLPWEAATA
ncbi:hypothetical protein [Streptomyces sp. 1331.2]|uniref:hypothetical protein n=1 Tax=Streptomyces sp. 1331.2 TaxID=1938835 RepID=UPI000BC42D65|nr:hypothetical protein [Streptomyces sp. 1331.2]SOB78716.1 hypothetical protein SAMN06272789_0049 [Streptomyces sp. 1331.2]